MRYIFMPDPANSAESPNLLSKFISVVGLLGAALFFAGWIYRWAYFAFFQLDVTALDLPAQSFLIVPIQVFLGTWSAFGKTLLMVILAALAISFTLWLLRRLAALISNRSHRRAATSPSFTQAFLSEVVIVAWIFVFLFWAARWQGQDDAWRDARHSTSTLPVVALITPSDKIALGRPLNDVFESTPLKGIGIIGDVGLFKALRGKEDTDTTNPDQPRVWRLLLNRGDWIYLFITLPSNAERDLRPSVLAAQKGGGQFIILSPEPSKP